MSETNDIPHIPFDVETWDLLPDLLDHLQEPVCLNVWGDENASSREREAFHLARTLAEHFEMLDWRPLPQRVNYRYYPVFGIMKGTAEDSQDLGLRIIGLPAGVQLTTLIAAIQAAAFAGQTVEPLTRIKLHGLAMSEDPPQIAIEVLTSDEDEVGAVVAKYAFGMAAASDLVRTFAIMVNDFPEATLAYSAPFLPHITINKRIHFSGGLDEEGLLEQIGLLFNDGQQ